jgi:hypothetical protein
MICSRLDRGAASQKLRPAIFEKLESRRLLSGIPASANPPHPLTAYLTPLPASVLTNSRGIAGISISNPGPNRAVGKLQISLLATTDGTSATTVATVRTITQPLDLTVGSFQRFALHFTYPASLAAGSYKFIAAVDFDGAISQSPSSNQGVIIAPPFVNLAAYFAQTPTLYVIGRIPPPELSLAVSNSGNTLAKGNVSIGLYESPTQTLSDTSILIDTFSNMPISIGANATETLTLNQKKVPLGASTGSEFLIAVLNANNTRSQLRTSAINAVSTFPTIFTTVQFTSMPTQAAVGGTVSITLLVANGETAPVQGDVDISILQSPTPSLGAAPNLLETFSDRPINIPVNGTQTYTLNLKVPLTAIPGYQFLVATLTPVAPLAASRTTDATIVAQGITTFS